MKTEKIGNFQQSAEERKEQKNFTIIENIPEGVEKLTAGVSGRKKALRTKLKTFNIAYINYSISQ